MKHPEYSMMLHREAPAANEGNRDRKRRLVTLLPANESTDSL
jgi:hypothetical protein